MPHPPASGSTSTIMDPYPLIQKVSYLLFKDEMKIFTELYSEKSYEPEYYFTREVEKKPKLDFLKHFEKNKLLFWL